MSLRKKQRRIVEVKEKNIDLNITPMMSLMVVLIPVLLFGAKYSLLSKYEMNISPPIIAQVNYQKVKDDNIDIIRYRLTIEDKRIVFKNKNLVLLDVKTSDKTEMISLLKATFLKIKSKGILSVVFGKELKYKYAINFLDVINSNKKYISNISISVKDQNE